MASTPEYQPFLKYSDDPAAEETSPPQHPVKRRTTVLSHVLVFVATSLVWGFVVFLIVPSPMPTSSTQVSASTHPTILENHLAGIRHNVTSGKRLINCGNSTEEAKAQGCKYDILLNHWVPGPCFDKESVDEYRDDNSWGAFSDINMTHRLTIDEMSNRDFYWTSIRDHINHCAIMWRRQFYVLFDERRAMDTVVTSPGHTEHCSQYLMDVTEGMFKEPTKTMRGFAGCWIKD
ncbi:hypothetical protein CGCF415_v013441 [Colletotrichum fructicola]|uniref:Uncharacterized protein n=2 Tax=Colletotrichum gloeosporioides species complex TaxID=2707338 RepID=L2FXX5_COLFN|nr:uncharacterized protein CGMCC3_g2442 [Colletotrichum fructicola]XP_037186252.1 uncharacterized protein CGCA056_v002010 [Colletotrichum aenigma]KAF0328561.1 hypothetical protein GQ607_004357 [Colletotrichum asianum]KAF4483077.1 hypothetical protein CGGC5_v010266 [Colletotrichum fructicola Nara gc5]KAE9582027.1 hypothetical protein CGMCC3_g2442 [Colletotrichum fructicola]KAF4882859.1 hypothetical protein CGCFRS4_v014139 [Colletotrichum fructicola]KAF4891258.1 hypothetical protein CGCF415_v01